MKYRLQYGNPCEYLGWEQGDPPHVGWQECEVIFDAQTDEEAIAYVRSVIAEKIVTFEGKRYHASIIHFVEERPVAGWEQLNKIGSDAPDFASNGEAEIKAITKVRELIQRYQQPSLPKTNDTPQG